MTSIPEGMIMARYEFKFVLSDVELSDDQQARVGQAVAQAGALALAELTPTEALTVRIGPLLWWRGIPPIELQRQIEQAARAKSEGER
jgi:hypothetical protein